MPSVERHIFGLGAIMLIQKILVILCSLAKTVFALAKDVEEVRFDF